MEIKNIISKKYEADEVGEKKHTSEFKIVCQSGLCNRLRVLLSGYVACKFMNKKMNFIWIKNSRCGANFSDLFENKEFNIVNYSFFYPFIYKYFYRRKEIVFGDNKPKGESEFDVLNMNYDDVIVRSNKSLFVLGDEFPNHSKLRKESELLFDTLRPISYIQNEVDNFIKNNFNGQNKIMGLHIRRGDFVDIFSDKTKNFDLFIKEMDNFIERNKDGKFFVATDDGAPSPWGRTPEPENVLDKLIERYGEDKILYYKPRSLDRNKKEAIQDALAILLILRKTDEFVGNCHSSFSGTVMLNRDVPQKRI